MKNIHNNIDREMISKYHMSESEIEDYIERVGIIIDSGISEYVAIKLALQQLGKIKKIN